MEGDMGDLVTQAKTARETLARALGALQSDPTVPPGLLAVAEPVAQAMGALHAIERSAPNVSLTTAPAARDHIRSALGMLQTQGGSHAAVATATEAVATSLGVVFGLVRAGEAAAAAPAPAPAAPAPAPAATGPGTTSPLQPTPAIAAQPAPAPQQAAPAPQAYQQPQPQAAPAPAPQAYQQPQPQAAPQAYQQPPQQPAAPAPQAYQQPQPAAQPYGAAAPQGYQQQPNQPAPHASEPAYHPPAQAQAPAPAAAPATNAVRFDAPLGTNSNSNFYKGLSGNDVVEHGGLFIATYAKIPPMGAPVSLHVVLPGGYEFEAMAVIAWTRENGSSDAPPGFGARFTQISPEARQLIYRYVRNREPLFHDDF
jgi:hypothetical protein